MALPLLLLLKFLLIENVAFKSLGMWQHRPYDLSQTPRALCGPHSPSGSEKYSYRGILSS